MIFVFNRRGVPSESPKGKRISDLNATLVRARTGSRNAHTERDSCAFCYFLSYWGWGWRGDSGSHESVMMAKGGRAGGGWLVPLVVQRRALFACGVYPEFAVYTDYLAVYLSNGMVVICLVNINYIIT